MMPRTNVQKWFQNRRFKEKKRNPLSQEKPKERKQENQDTKENQKEEVIFHSFKPKEEYENTISTQASTRSSNNSILELQTKSETNVDFHFPPSLLVNWFEEMRNSMKFVNDDLLQSIFSERWTDVSLSLDFPSWVNSVNSIPEGNSNENK